MEVRFLSLAHENNAMKKIPYLFAFLTMLIAARFLSGISGLWLIGDKDEGLSFLLLNLSGIAAIGFAIKNFLEEKHSNMILIIVLTATVMVIATVTPFYIL
jgi:hypothetical protein